MRETEKNLIAYSVKIEEYLLVCFFLGVVEVSSCIYYPTVFKQKGIKLQSFAFCRWEANKNSRVKSCFQLTAAK